MYRSKLADRMHLISRLKLAFAVLLLVFTGLAVWHFTGREGDTIPVCSEVVYTEAAYTEVVYAESAAPLIAEVIENTYEDFEANESEYTDIEYESDVPQVSPVVRHIPENEGLIALTFDDGPGPLTKDLLDILEEYDVRVTFCVIGKLVENNADTVLRAFEAGHEIIGHSWDHSDFSRLSVQQITEQIQKTSAVIELVTGEEPPRLFRVPFGLFNTRIKNAASELGYGVLNWSIDPRDWRDRDEDIIYDFIMENARDGAIVVLHDVHQTTIDAMARVIPSLIYEGYTLVTASEVLEYVYGIAFEAGFEYTGIRR
jgi:peptidoglycan/xylan/chitin deacetylase (PgdA/CDA1 family)